jgi:histidinol-phosphate aminotransferase
MYRIAAVIQGALIIDVPRQAEKDFQIDFEKLLQAINGNANVKLVFLTSPNNPTGDLVGRAQLEAVLEACEHKALVVMDEAYIEFCSAGSSSDLLEKWSHLVVLRTLSKAWAAAGVRCGTVIANPAVISLLRRVIAPYPLAATAIDAALQAISGAAIGRQNQFVKTVIQGRADLIEFLGKCDWIERILESEANFVLIRVSDANDLVNWCADRGIRIRNFTTQTQLQGCVRLTIGSTSEMSELKSVVQAYGERA